MSDLVARTGRLQQRYNDGCRLVAGYSPSFSFHLNTFFFVIYCLFLILEFNDFLFSDNVKYVFCWFDVLFLLNWMMMWDLFLFLPLSFSKCCCHSFVGQFGAVTISFVGGFGVDCSNWCQCGYLFSLFCLLLVVWNPIFCFWTGQTICKVFYCNFLYVAGRFLVVLVVSWGTLASVEQVSRFRVILLVCRETLVSIRIGHSRHKFWGSTSGVWVWSTCTLVSGFDPLVTAHLISIVKLPS